MTASALALRPHGLDAPLHIVHEPEPDDFGVIPAGPWKQLSFCAKAILGTLCLMAKGKTELRASYEDVMREVGLCGRDACSLSTVRRGIRELAKLGVVELPDVGRGFRFLFRIKGRRPENGSIFRPSEVSRAARTAPPVDGFAPPVARPSYIVTTDYTTTPAEPSSSSSLVSTPEDGDQVRALGVRVARLWAMDEDYSAGLVGNWAKQFPGGLDRIDHAIQLAEARRVKPQGPNWVFGTLANWKQHGEPPRPVAAKPAPAPPPARPRVEPEPYDAPLPEEIDEWFARAADESAHDWQRRNAVTCIREAVRNGVLDASVLEGFDLDRSAENKPAAGPATNYPRHRPPMTDSRGDSSLNGGSEQDSHGAPVLRSARSGRVLRACSSFRAIPPDPAGTGEG